MAERHRGLILFGIRLGWLRGEGELSLFGIRMEWLKRCSQQGHDSMTTTTTTTTTKKQKKKFTSQFTHLDSDWVGRS